MADHAISFDEGVEILRGPTAALEIHARRTRLALAAMPDPWGAPASPEPGDFLAPREFLAALTEQDLEVAEDLASLDPLQEAGFSFRDARKLFEPEY